MKVRVSLVEMAAGQDGSVAEVRGGHDLVRRLEAMGIRPGAELAKVSGPYMRGPVTVKVGNSQVAIGFGMAGKVMVEVETSKVLLMGNPNVGKSVVFNRLTGANVVSSNYPGTTVEFTKGTMRVEGRKAEVIDVPGTYTLEATSRAEAVAVKMLDEMDEGDVIIDVVDATNLERSLNLTLQLLARRKPLIVALNLWDETKHTGVRIDVAKLEEILGVPCVPLIAIIGSGIKTLVDKITQARVSSYEFDDAERWHEIGNIVAKVQEVTHKHHTFLEKLGDASVRPLTGMAIAAIVLAGAFEIVRLVGEGLIAYVFEPIFEHLWAPVMMGLSGYLGGEGFLHNILVGEVRVTDGEVDLDHLFGESFGLLTTGLFVPIAAVLPYVFAFYLVLSFLEDSGYLPRLAVLTDNVMHRLGLHGMGIIPMLLGLGCNVPGALATRIMESRRERFISATLMAICVPCMAQIAMIFGLAGKHGARAFVPIFGTLFLVWLVLGRLLGKFLPGESPEILIDIPPYRIPYLRGIAKKMWMRMVWFLKEALPWVLAGVLAVNILYALGVIEFVGWLASPVVKGVLGLPKEAVGGLVVGFLRKDLAVGMLKPLGLSLRQMVVACVVLSMYFPCVATFAVMMKELGVKGMLKSAAVMFASAFAVGGLLNLVMWAFARAAAS
ncbi:MAG: FeoB small GTPase domain-containing protein [Planctomycetota bacterium]